MNSETKSRVHNELETVPDALLPFLPEFYENRKKELKLMQEFHTQSDWDEIRKIAHTWKGFCAPYGFASLGLVAGELEQKLKSGAQPEDVEQYIEIIEKYLDEAGENDRIQIGNV